MSIPAFPISAVPSLAGLSKPLAARQQQALLLLIAAAIALSSHFCFLLLLPDSWMQKQSSDFVMYYQPVAQSLASGGGFYLASKPALLYPGGLPIIYAATFRISDTLHLARGTGLRLLEALLLTLSSVLVSLIARSLLSWRIALVATTLWSAYPFHLWLTKQPDASSMVSLLLLLAVFLFIKWCGGERRSAPYGCLVGLTLGMAALIKPITIALPVLFVGFACLCAIPCRRRQRAVFSACLVIAYLLPISPWELWARKVSGEWILLCTNGPNVLIDGLTFGTVRGLKSVWMPERVKALTEDAVAQRNQLKTAGSIAKFLIGKVREEPTVVAQFFLIKAARSWYGTETHNFERWILAIQLLYLPFVMFGAVEMWKGNRQQRLFLWVATVTALYFWGITTLASLPDLRYLIPAISLVMIVAAVGVDALAIRLCQRLVSGGHDSPIAQEA